MSAYMNRPVPGVKPSDKHRSSDDGKQYQIAGSIAGLCRHIIFSLIILVFATHSDVIGQLSKQSAPRDKYAGLTAAKIRQCKVFDSHFFDKITEIERDKSLGDTARSLAKYRDPMFQVDMANRVRVEIGVPELNPGYAARLAALGFEQVYENKVFHRYDGWLPLSAVNQISELDFISFVRAVEKPIVSVTSAGDAFHRADIARSDWGIDGSNRKVGIISTGVNHLWGSQNAGELPSAVQVINDRWGGDEGTAMLEIVHDLAPGSALSFADMGSSESDFANNIQLLWDAGCQIICDDIYYYHEPAFEDGIIAQEVNQITGGGGLYFSSAGNFRQTHYIGDFVNNGDNRQQFSLTGGGTSNYLLITVAPNKTVTITLQWNEQYGSSGGDYDLYLYDANDNYLAKSSTTQNGDDDPYEAIQYTNNTTDYADYKVVILNYNGAAPQRKLQLWFFGGVTLESQGQKTESSLFGHTAALGCVSVAAIDEFSVQRYYSSEGPVLIYSYDGSGNPTAYSQRTKPDLSALDGVQTYVGQQGFFSNPFYGTSAAAPHAAAVAALTWSTKVSNTASYIRNVLENSATNLPLSNSGKNNQYGQGRVDAYDAMSLIRPPGTITVSSPSASAVWKVGDAQSIQWNAKLYSGTFAITLKKSGVVVATIATNVSGSTYLWTIPMNMTRGQDYTVVVSSTDGTIAGESGVFSIIDLGSGLIAYYPFNGNANDESGNGSNGTVTGATLVPDRLGKTNSAYHFNGTTDEIECGNSSILQSDNFTVACWVKPDVMPIQNSPTIITKSNKDTDGWTLQVYNSNHFLFEGSTSGSHDAVASSYIPVAGQWCFVAMTYDATSQQLRAYINGVLDTTETFPIARAVSRDLTIGNGYNTLGYNGTSGFQGAIDDIRIYNCALSDAEISALYLQGGTVPAGIVANMKVFLQGPFNAGAMTTTLNTSGLIPLTSETAYPAATYGYTASTVASIPNTSIVDWLLVELRSETAGATKFAARAGFLKSDGTIVNIDGASPLSFAEVLPGNYYVVVRHRNHVAIMSGAAVALSSTSVLYDFTTAQTQAYGTNAMAALAGGAFGMIAGDVNQDGIIKYNLGANDRALIYVRIGGDLVNATVSGYYPEDVNLDGVVKYNLSNNDRGIIYVNIGGGTVNATVSTKVPDAGLPEGGGAVKATVLKKEPKSDLS